MKELACRSVLDLRGVPWPPYHVQQLASEGNNPKDYPVMRQPSHQTMTFPDGRITLCRFLTHLCRVVLQRPGPPHLGSAEHGTSLSRRATPARNNRSVKDTGVHALYAQLRDQTPGFLPTGCAQGDRPEPDRRHPAVSLIAAPRGHSQKPARLFGRVHHFGKMWPVTARVVELFARRPRRNGWEVWGN